MKVLISNILKSYKRCRSFAGQSRPYRVVKYSVGGLGLIYASLLLFPQVLFGHNLEYKNFVVYSREPFNEKIYEVLDAAEAKLQRSPFYNPLLTERLILADSFGTYKFMTITGNSMGSTIPFVGHSRINKSSIEGDLVFHDSPPPNQRSLSGVIAHETMHNQIIEHLGPPRYMVLPKWKDEGYCEYIAGETTLSFDEGLRRWTENPNDPSGYAYFRYHQMVKYLLDVEKISVETLFSADFDETKLAEKVLLSLSQSK